MPREQQAGAQDDDAEKCAAPQLDQQELRSRKRILIQAILTEYTNKRKIVTQGVVLKMAIQACIKTVQVKESLLSTQGLRSCASMDAATNSLSSPKSYRRVVRVTLPLWQGTSCHSKDDEVHVSEHHSKGPQ